MIDQKQLSKLEFVAFCIEQYKKMANKGGSQVERMFRQLGVIDFLLDHYDVLHTQGESAIMNEIEEFIKYHPL